MLCFYSYLNHVENVVEMLLSPTQAECESDLYGKMTPGFFIQNLTELLWTKVWRGLCFVFIYGCTCVCILVFLQWGQNLHTRMKRCTVCVYTEPLWFIWEDFCVHHWKSLDPSNVLVGLVKGWSFDWALLWFSLKGDLERDSHWSWGTHRMASESFSSQASNKFLWGKWAGGSE